jgi:hypothetical protein
MSHGKSKPIKGIPFKEEEASLNYAEFSVSKKAGGKIRNTRILLILLYMVFSVGFISLFTVFTKLLAIIAVLPLFLWILWYFTWKYTLIDFTYIAYQGKFYVYKVNGYGHAKEVLCKTLSANEIVAPYNGEYKKNITSCDEKFNLTSGSNPDDVYYAIFGENGKKTLVLFDASANLLKSLRFYGGESVTVTFVSH